ncbi:hypothetical protein ACB092_04G039600 [Castanea dentata]
MSFFKGSPEDADHWDNEKLGIGGSDSDYNSNSIRTPLLRWRQSALLLNASHRFRYALDLRREEDRKQNLRLARAHAQAILAAYLFKAVGVQASEPPPSSSGDFSIGLDQLALISSDHNVSILQQYGGLKGLSDLLETNLDKGIQGDAAGLTKRRNAFGSNTYPRKKGRSFLMFLWEAWQDLTVIILIAAAVASLALGIKTEGIKQGWYDGESIAFAVILIIVVRAIINYIQSLQFQSLQEVKQNSCGEVIREGRRMEVSVCDVVVGDIVLLNIDDQVPADGVLISGNSLAIDESSVTGESRIAHKDSQDPFLMSGCKVADGNGTMLVTSVGINTKWGLLMASTSEDIGEELLGQVHSKGVLIFIGKAGLSIAVIVSVVILVRHFIHHRRAAGKEKVGDALDVTIKNIVTIAVSIIVVTMPERRTLVSTIALAHSVPKIMADKVLVRRLSAFETVASTTIICSDKTGTLTLNQMAVVEAYVGGKKIDPCNNKSELSPKLFSLLLEGIALNTKARVHVLEDTGDIEVFGSPTEKAILYWGKKLGMKFETIKSESPVIRVFPFNSETKRGGIAVQVSESQVHVHWKGATETVLASCAWYIDATDQLVALDEDKRLDAKKAIEDMAARGLRCIANAYRLYDIEKGPCNEEQLAQWALPEDDLVLLAIVGIKDPCQPGVKDAVQLCQNAGVKVRMVTGDNLQTAKAIALECGILGSDAEATKPNLIEAGEFLALSDIEREETVDGISVMGRCSPNDKLVLVQGLRKRGHVVAVIGDGINDAPALNEADIGLAMGISGTRAAKESSDIIILDDNFASVVKAVRWGRSVHENIQKFIQFERSANIAALIINVIAAISPGDVPLNAVQLLWVNLIVDTLGPLALATESPKDYLMHRPPVGRRESFTKNIIWRNLLIQTLYQVSVLLVLNFRGRSLLNLENDKSNHANEVKNTLIFNSFVLCQIFNEFNARRPDELNVFKGVTKNCLFMGIVGLTVVLQAIIIEFLGKFTSTVRLTWSQWLISMVIGFISWPLDFLGKLIPVPATPFNKFFTSFHPRCLSKKKGDSQDSIEELFQVVVDR